MGLMDKIKGMAKGKGSQVNKGVDTAAQMGKAKAPDQYDSKIDSAASQAKKAGQKLSD